jgi:hypothetical protein
MGGPGSGSSELSAENSCHVNISRCLELYHHQEASTESDSFYKKGKKMPQYRPRKGGSAAVGFDDGTVNGDYRRPRRIRKR